MKNMGTIVNSHTVRFERLLPGPIERVWDYISTADGMAIWHRCMADFSLELARGGRFSCSICPPPAGVSIPPEAFADMPAIPERGLMRRPRGQVTECVAPRVLAYSFIDTACDVVSEVRFELEQRGDEVLLIFTHSQLPSDMMAQVAAGWHAHLDALVAVLNGETPADFMLAFLEHYKKYSVALAATLVVVASAAPALANSSDEAYKVLQQQRSVLLDKYDRTWKAADDLKHQLTVLSRERTEDVSRAEGDLQRQLSQKYDDLHRIEMDIHDLDKSLI